MLGTYASVLAVCVASLLVGGAAMRLCGRREWSWLSPAVGLALLCALCWGTVRLPGEGAISAAAVLVAVLCSAAYLWGRVEGRREAVRAGLPVAAVALLATSLPFLAEGHFGILGTGFNPDMSQHLLAADRLAAGAASPLVVQGYPLGPHSVVVALHDGLGVGLVDAFSGLTLSIGVLACLTALGALGRFSDPRRLVGALLVGLPYMVASYLAQGAFKETMQALFVLGFAIALLDLERDPGPGEEGAARHSDLCAVPAALIAVGSAYAYSFPGLAWIAATAGIWALARLALERAGGKPPATLLRRSLRPALLAVLALAVLTAPELGRMLDFRRFETFNPAGPGLGNLFGQISPFEGLGIWPSGDFRLTPGAGAVPAVGYYVGVALAIGVLAYGVVSAARRREAALLSALGAALVAYLVARVDGTAYTAAKAVVMVSRLAMLVSVRPLLGLRASGSAPTGIRTVLAPLAAACFLVGAGVCSALALANAPVGPASYTPKLTELRPLLARTSALVLESRAFLTERHGVSYLTWELRGGRVCVAATEGRGNSPPRGVRFVIAPAGLGRPYGSVRLARRAGPYYFWRVTGPVRGPSACPLIAVRSARQGGTSNP
ncbi:MAG: hypothetical protein U0R52_09965 [Solirubrobacterales bacterium]